MAIADLRPPGACLAPVPIDPVVADPDQIRDMARANGPYFMPARYLVRSTSAAGAANDTEATTANVPAGLIGPTFRGDWATHGQALVDGAAELLQHSKFLDATAAMYQTNEIVPEQVFVNLNAPSGGQAFSHVDIPEFAGIDRTNAPGWLLQAMGISGLFEDVRLTIVTAVAWFYTGERGFFRYWPQGRDGESVRHEAMWNTAVAGDNDFMHHKVERVGPADLSPPDAMTIDTHLRHDGESWVIEEAGRALARYDDDQIRLSLSWKAKVYESAEHREHMTGGGAAIDLAEVHRRFADHLGPQFAAPSVDDLLTDPTRDQLSGRWSGYVVG